MALTCTIISDNPHFANANADLCVTYLGDIITLSSRSLVDMTRASEACNVGSIPAGRTSTKCLSDQLPCRSFSEGWPGILR